MTIEEQIGEWRERANTLRITGHAHDGHLVDQVLDALVATPPLDELLAWVNERDAMLYEGRRTPDTLRDRFAEWEARGLAKWNGKRRLYRRIVLRHRGNVEAAREEGRRAGRGASAA